MFSLQRYVDEYCRLLTQLEPAAIERFAQVLLHAWKTNRTVFCCGNGGSAANASHFVTDLTKLTAPLRGRRLRALALTDSLPSVSAIANDISYDEVFVEQLKPFISTDDVLVAFSTSGTSPNVIRAVHYANELGAVTVAVTGQQGVALQGWARHALVLHSKSVQQIEDATMMVGHMLCLRTRELIARECRDIPLPQAADARPALRVGNMAGV